MNIVFVEYRLKEKSLQQYAQWMRKVQEKYKLEVVEGTDQPNVMVEIWRVPPGAQRFMHERRDANHEQWAPLLEMIEGGPEKLNIWEFQPWTSY